MEVSAHLPASPEPVFELVVTSGPHAGLRFALVNPLTLIGQAPSCDVRLDDSVAPLHCAIALGPPITLRDLSGTNIRVNGVGISTGRLAQGDQIEVGSWTFTVELPPPGTSETPIPDLPHPGLRDQAEQEALRIQVAAVAAQQCALVVLEARLDQRSTAMEQQQQQLASHLDERRRKLLELREQVRQERIDSEADCQAAREEARALREDAGQELADAQTTHRGIAKERARLVELRKRLKKRWKRHWSSQESSLANREMLLRRQAENLEQERNRLQEVRLSQNADFELGQRHLREEWQELGLAQQQLEDTINQEQADRARQHHLLVERETRLSVATQALGEEKRLWESYLTNLRRESDELEARIRNQRNLLTGLGTPEVQPKRPSPQINPIPEAPPRADSALVAPLPRLTQLAGDLADQRLHLTEQWQKLLEVQDRWQQERETALADLEQMARQLDERDTRVLVRERSLIEQEVIQRNRQEELTHHSHHLQGWHARLIGQLAAWTNERDNLVEDLEARERMLQWRGECLEEVQRRRNHRRQQELADLQAARTRCEETRQRYLQLYLEVQQQQTALNRQQQRLQGQSLAIERYLQEVGANASRAEGRIEKLNRRELARLDASDQELRVRREELQTEAHYLDGLARDLSLREELLLQNEEELKNKMEELEARQRQSDDEERQRQLQLGRLRARHEHDKRQLVSLREELDRLARSFMEESTILPESARAA